MNVKGVCVDEMKGENTSIGDGSRVLAPNQQSQQTQSDLHDRRLRSQKEKLSPLSRNYRDEERIWVTCVAEKRRRVECDIVAKTKKKTTRQCDSILDEQAR